MDFEDPGQHRSPSSLPQSIRRKSVVQSLFVPNGLPPTVSASAEIRSATTCIFISDMVIEGALDVSGHTELAGSRGRGVEGTHPIRSANRGWRRGSASISRRVRLTCTCEHERVDRLASEIADQPNGLRSFANKA